MKRRTFITTLVSGATGLALHSLASPLYAQRLYLNEEQALHLVFPKSEKIGKEWKALSQPQLQQLEQTLRYKPESNGQPIYRGETAGQTDGYAMIVNEIGKDQFITFIVGITPQFKVQRVALMVFRETRGDEVRDERFTNQFRGKTGKDRLLIGSDIIGITGATLSSRAFCRGTKRALLICEMLYKQ